MSSRRSSWVVGVAASLYAAVLSVVTLLMLSAFAAEHDLGIFAQYVWLLGHGDEPFSTITLRPMLDDHFQPTLALLAPLGALDVAAGGLLVVQAIAIAAVSPLLLIVARRHGATGWLAVVPALLWLVSPVVVKANLFEFHPDALFPALLIGSVVALTGGRTWLFAVLLALGVGLKEDAGLTVAALGLALAWTGRRRLGTMVLVSGAAWSFAMMFVVLPQASAVVRRHYTGQFVGDRADSVPGLALHLIRHPVDAVGGVLALDRLGIVVLLIATCGGLCLLAPRWMVVAVPSIAINLLSAYDPQRTLDYHYWLVAAGSLALAGAIGAGQVPVGWRAGWIRGAGITAGLLLVLSIGALSAALGEVRAEWPRRADRLAAVRAVPVGASVSVPQRFFAPLADRRSLYALPEPLEPTAPATEWGSKERQAAIDGLDVVIIDGASPERVPEATLERLGFHPVLRRGEVVVYERRS